MLEKKYYDVSEAAKILNLSEYTVREKIRNKELKAIREKGQRAYKIERECLLEYAQNTTRNINVIDSTAPIDFEGENIKSINPKYAEDYSQEGFWEKIIKFYKKVGEDFIRSAIQLFYVANEPQCPAGVKATVFAALGYFILPFDLIPDVIPVMGFGDDIMMLGIAAKIIESEKYINNDIINKTNEIMQVLGITKKGAD